MGTPWPSLHHSARACSPCCWLLSTEWAGSLVLATLERFAYVFVQQSCGVWNSSVVEVGGHISRLCLEVWAHPLGCLGADPFLLLFKSLSSSDVSFTTFQMNANSMCAVSAIWKENPTAKLSSSQRCRAVGSFCNGVKTVQLVVGHRSSICSQAIKGMTQAQVSLLWL